VRKFLFLVITLSICALSHAQVKRLEHNFYLGLGGVNSTPYNDDSYAFRLGYGINCYFSNHWSFMPGVAVRARFEPGDEDGGEGAYDCTYIDIPLLAQYHLSSPKKSGLVVECGPVFSFIVSNNSYYIDADPANRLNDKNIYKTLDLGIQPGIYYQLANAYLFDSIYQAEYPNQRSYKYLCC
jgi:hypothetical protein